MFLKSAEIFLIIRILTKGFEFKAYETMYLFDRHDSTKLRGIHTATDSNSLALKVQETIICASFCVAATNVLQL